MLQKLKNHKEDKSGFTIIEVMIVLAIAGLIILIVLLAVPALQRSARNTQRREDASAMAGAIADFIDNNNGQVPAYLSDNGSTNSLQVSLTWPGNVELAKLGYYTLTGTTKQSANSTSDGEVYSFPAAASATAPLAGTVNSTPTSTNVTQNSAVILWQQDCTPTNNPRTAAIYYVTETGSGNGAVQCVEQ